MFLDGKGSGLHVGLHAVHPNIIRDIVGRDKFLQIEMPCGQVYVYQDPTNVPSEDFLCDCGNPNHYVLKYEMRDG